VPAPAAIACRELTRRFGAFVAVDRVSFDVPVGSIVGFLGPNGSGKSTTIRMLCGILRPTSGTARVGGVDVVRDPEGVKRQIGYMSQRFSLYEDLSVHENLSFFAGVYGLRGRRRSERLRETVQMAGLAGDEATLVRSLSVGVRQRLSLGAALLHQPPILFLDEPTSGVDPISRRRFWDLIYDLADDGTTILVTTHYMDEAEHCQRLVMIRDGAIVGRGSPRELKAGLLPGPVLAVACDRPIEATQVLAGAPGVRWAAPQGGRLRVATDGAAAEAIVRQTLARGGIAVASVEPARPTLDDVFVAVTQGASR
jgi:ABC-2 type transport system ATP-binding protein